MCHVTIVEPVKLKNLLDFLFIEIVQNNKYKGIDIRPFSFFGQVLQPKMCLNDSHPFFHSFLEVKA